MPLKRTPPPAPPASSPQRIYDSAPDLTGTDSGPSEHDSAMNITTRHKRKREDCSCDEKFFTFSEKLSNMVANSIKQQDEKFNIIQSSMVEIITQNKNVGKDLAVLNSSIGDIRTEISSVRAEFNDVKNSITDLKKKNSELESDLKDVIKSMEYTSSQQDTLEASMKKFQESIKTTDTFESEINTLRTSVSDLKLELNTQQQRNLLCNLEISGLPESTSEDLGNIAINLAKYAGVTLTREDIDHINRVQPRQRNPGRPRNVVMKLRSRILKDNILAGIRKNRGVTTLDISMPGDTRRIFINEHLTVDNKILYKQCREAAKSKYYQYVWTKNCRIFMRKNETSPMTLIKQEQDLKKLH